MDCDPPGGFDKGDHKKEHSLLKVQETAGTAKETREEAAEDGKPPNSALESKAGGEPVDLQSSLQGFADKIRSLDDKLTAMDLRSSRIEEKLDKLLLQRAGAESGADKERSRD